MMSEKEGKQKNKGRVQKWLAVVEDTTIHKQEKGRDWICMSGN